MPQNQTNKILPHDPTQATIAKFPAWTTLPKQPVTFIQAGPMVETNIDTNGVGQVRVKPGYDVNISEIRYGF